MPSPKKAIDLVKTIAENMRKAQINATKMLGLPPDNTPMDRARAMGFDTPAYHGTNRQFEEFSNEMLGAKTGAKSAQKAHFSAQVPEVANSYVSTSHVFPLAGKGGAPAYEQLFKIPNAWDEYTKAPTDQDKWMVLEKYGLNLSHGQVMPLLLNMGKSRVKDYKGAGYRDVTYNDELKAAKRQGKDSVIFKNTYDAGPHEGNNVMSDIYAIPDPSRIRSRFAAFDPARINENDLLAGVVAAPLGLLDINYTDK